MGCGLLTGTNSRLDTRVKVCPVVPVQTGMQKQWLASSKVSVWGHQFTRGGGGEGSLLLRRSLGKAPGFFQFGFVAFPDRLPPFLPGLPRFSPGLCGSGFSFWPETSA